MIAMVKLTRDQAQARKDKAVRFASDVLEDDDLADEIEDESLEDYAERRRIQITNPRRRAMAKRQLSQTPPAKRVA